MSAVPECRLPDPLDPKGRPAPDQFCDLILQGGVVDGVIYPGLLIELARHYRFQSIAGTSVGAIAASLTAACEYSRRFGSDDGFNEVLRKIPEELAKIPDPATGETKIRTLFQADSKLGRLFEVLVQIVAESPGSKGAVRRMLGVLFRAYGMLFAVGMALGLAMGLLLSLPLEKVIECWYQMCSPGLHGHTFVSFVNALIVTPWRIITVGVPLGLFLGVLTVSLAVLRDYRLLAATNGFGFCSGLAVSDSKHEALIDWLHRGIQGAAKLPLTRPLTFQDLWEAPGGPKDTARNPAARSIDLRMVATCLTHGRPYEFPHQQSVTPLFFKLDDLTAYFPAVILEHLKQRSQVYTKPEKYYPLEPSIEQDVYKTPIPKIEGVTDGQLIRALPVAELPILVAVRLSMNFPVLFKAVPLWAIDEERGLVSENGGPRAPEFGKVLFTDGGVTSNFPIHFFDKPIPAWPTFGVLLAEKSRQAQPVDRDDVRQPLFFLPKLHTAGRWERWFSELIYPNDEHELQGQKPAFFGYLSCLFSTAKDWANNANLRMPGIRDRVVTVFKNDQTKGGLDLNLKPDAILALGYVHGTAAGNALIKKFHSDPSSFNENLVGTPGWLDHRWVRFNSYVEALKSHIEGFTESVKQVSAGSSLIEQIGQSGHKAPLRYEQCYEPTLSETQRDALLKAVHAIQALEASLAANAVAQPYEAKPAPDLKVSFRV